MAVNPMVEDATRRAFDATLSEMAWSPAGDLRNRLFACFCAGMIHGINTAQRTGKEVLRHAETAMDAKIVNIGMAIPRSGI